MYPQSSYSVPVGFNSPQPIVMMQQPAPIIVQQPAPVIVQQPAPIIMAPPQPQFMHPQPQYVQPQPQYHPQQHQPQYNPHLASPPHSVPPEPLGSARVMPVGRNEIQNANPDAIKKVETNDVHDQITQKEGPGFMNAPGVKLLAEVAKVIMKPDYAEKDGCLVKNHYNLRDNKNQEHLMKIIDRNTFCQRRCTPSCCRGYDFTIMDKEKNGLISAEKECQVCCCCTTPELKVSNYQTGEVVGYVSDPCNFGCTDEFEVRNKEKKKILKITGSKCQLGVLCPMACGPCRRADYTMMHAHREADRIGYITKENSCCNMCCSEMSGYSIEYSQIQNKDWKLMATAAAIFIDFRNHGEGDIK